MDAADKYGELLWFKDAKARVVGSAGQIATCWYGANNEGMMWQKMSGKTFITYVGPDSLRATVLESRERELTRCRMVYCIGDSCKRTGQKVCI